jgi:hypothetical protein
MKKPPKWGGGRRAQSITPSQPNKNLDVTNPLTCPQQKKIFFIWLRRHLTGSARPVPFSHPLGLLLNFQMREKKGKTTDSKPTSLIKGQHKEGHI